jgi:death-on-curing protein
MPEAGGSAETVYLGVDDVLDLYGDIFECTPEQAADQLRSPGNLEGALARPLWHELYGGADLALQAAVLAHGIAETQPFIDGNKRVALAALRTFLVVNGYTVVASQAERAGWILALSGGLTPDELASKLRAAMTPEHR